jgi:hypothetical protein
MITPQVLLNHIVAQPFEPFRIHTASGRSFEVRHPEFVQVGLSTISVFAPPEGSGDEPQRWEKVSMMLIASLSPLKSSVGAPTK